MKKGMVIDMEIERKWWVAGWPVNLELLQIHQMDQGYISVRPTVRIRREALVGGKTELVLCFKGAPGAGGLSRQEIETTIDAELFSQLEELIGKPLIRKERRTYLLPDGHHLEVNCVDRGQPSAFWYAEVEFDAEETARAWSADSAGLGEYLTQECTGVPGASMGEYWIQTRL